VYGTGNAALTLANVLQVDAASYSAVITNAYNSVTSSVASLEVVDPAAPSPLRALPWV
jgi:hypothetical protein